MHTTAAVNAESQDNEHRSKYRYAIVAVIAHGRERWVGSKN